MSQKELYKSRIKMNEKTTPNTSWGVVTETADGGFNGEPKMMNERVKELADEATSYKEGLVEGKHDIEVFDKAKFAELIVREYADIIVYWGPFWDGLDSAQKMINKHFGVEE